MGDRTTTYFPCPKCGKEMEEYDAPSSVTFVSVCENCGWRDGRSYYETGTNQIELLTSDEASQRAFCNNCGLNSEALYTGQAIDWDKYFSYLDKLLIKQGSDQR